MPVEEFLRWTYNRSVIVEKTKIPLIPLLKFFVNATGPLSDKNWTDGDAF